MTVLKEQGLTKHIDLGRYFCCSMSVLGHARILSTLMPRNAVVKKQDIVGGHDFVSKLPHVVGLGVGLCGAQHLPA